MERSRKESVCGVSQNPRLCRKSSLRVYALAESLVLLQTKARERIVTHQLIEEQAVRPGKGPKHKAKHQPEFKGDLGDLG